jgi:glycosyltransferase involved in cell wall biosynthesis
MKVTALTTGRNDPSARFRIRQHIAPLEAKGVFVHEYIPVIDKHAGLPSVIADRTPSFLMAPVEAAWRYAKLAARAPGLIGSLSADLVWLNRELLPGRYTLERFLCRPFVLDVDDAVWLGRPDGAETMARLGRDAVAIFAGNSYIADWFSSYSRSIHIVPTAIDTDRFKPRVGDSRGDRPFTLGWTGSRGNFKYLYDIEAPLDEFLRKFDARLLVMAESPPHFARLDASRVIFRPWSIEIEASALQSVDVGLMPLPDNEWTRGKCSFKMLQYMSTGLPVVVSPVGMNQEVLSQGQVGIGVGKESEWYAAFEWLYQNREAALRMGEHGRTLVQERYSLKVVLMRIGEIFHNLA